MKGLIRLTPAGPERETEDIEQKGIVVGWLFSELVHAGRGEYWTASLSYRPGDKGVPGRFLGNRTSSIGKNRVIVWSVDGSGGARYEGTYEHPRHGWRMVEDDQVEVIRRAELCFRAAAEGRGINPECEWDWDFRKP